MTTKSKGGGTMQIRPRKKLWTVFTPVVISLTVILFSAACNGGYLRIFEKRGFDYNQEYTLQRLHTFQGVYGEVHGNYFFIKGSISGDLTSGTFLGFVITGPEGELLVVELPVSRMEFNIDNSKEMPTAKFDFKNTVRGYTIRDLREMSLAEMLNKTITKAEIRISQKDFDQDVYPRLQTKS